MSTPRENWRLMLQVRPVRNHAARMERTDTGLRFTVRKRKPRYLVPPLSWVIRPRLEESTRLDPMGVEILELCTGHRRAEQIVDLVAERFGLTFHEARISVASYLQALVQRGVVVLVVPDAEDA